MDGRGDHGEPVAIIGMACRFPGARDPAEFHDLAVTGRRMFQPVRALPGRPLRAAVIDDWAVPRVTQGDWSSGGLAGTQPELERGGLERGSLERADLVLAGLGQTDLDSAAPMHSPGMARCAVPLRSVLATTSFAPPRRRLVSTITGSLITPENDLAWLLATQVTRPVLSAQAMAQAAHTADLIVIAGPDAGLAGRAAECGGVPASGGTLASRTVPRMRPAEPPARAGGAEAAGGAGARSAARAPG